MTFALFNYADGFQGSYWARCDTARDVISEIRLERVVSGGYYRTIRICALLLRCMRLAAVRTAGRMLARHRRGVLPAEPSSVIAGPPHAAASSSGVFE